ncbi:MAG: tetratricopeptide repeat protein, partial [Gemmatimonadota bacterium]|nr:tetratricopeptide repeat protein [Gemmatimonadota bacterium]
IKASLLRAAGKMSEASSYCEKGRKARGSLDRFPFREESLRPLAQAVEFNPHDATARFSLGCLLYSLGRRSEALSLWEKGVELSPDDFSMQRALGLAYAEAGYGIENAARHLEAAIELNPDHIRTFTDLSDLYSRAGFFDSQLALLHRALKRSPEDDYIIEGLITTNLVKGDYSQADSLIRSHTFAQRHRSYELRDKYRFMRYGFGSKAFRNGDYEEALRQFEMALYPPGSLGADDFQYQSAPRLNYYIGLVKEKMGLTREARASFEKSSTGWRQLSGDRDSWNSENLYMIFSLEKLGRTETAGRLMESIENFALSQLESKYLPYRAEANYLLGLVKKKEGEAEEARRLFKEAVQVRPDILGPRFELRSDVVDPLPGG